MLTLSGRIASMGCLAAGLALVSPCGCAGKATPISAVPARPLRAASLEEVLAAHDGYCKGIDTLSAAGDLEVRDRRAGKARRLNVRLVAAREGKLYLKASISVVTALEVAADGRQFWFQVPSRKTVWTGRADVNPEAEDEQAPYYTIRPADVTAALLPQPLAPAADEIVLLTGDREAFTVTVATRPLGPARRAVSVDRGTLRPLRSRQYDERGDLVSEFVYGDVATGPARRVEVNRPREGYEVLFSFDKAEANVAVPAKAFAPRTPEGYKVVEVGR